jgi:hypothetical protein
MFLPSRDKLKLTFGFHCSIIYDWRVFFNGYRPMSLHKRILGLTLAIDFVTFIGSTIIFSFVVDFSRRRL